ncbi:MAG: non-heme iron oxygenase ferredoxin subunit [Candidatus Sumerlaeia bacterium]
MSSDYYPAAREQDVVEGRPLAVQLGGVNIVLCNVGGKIYAVRNVCSHDDGVLVGGTGEHSWGCLDGFAIECPRHGARFDVRDGSVLSMPAAYPIAAYDVKVEDGMIYVKVNGDE